MATTAIAKPAAGGNVIQFPTKKEKPKEIVLTAAQEKAWSDTRVKLLWHCPAFSHILYTMLNKRGSDHVAYFTRDIPIAATDGECLFLNPDTFFKYNLNERLFIVSHEIMHCIFNHIVLMFNFIRRGKVSYPDGTSLPFDAEVMNVAADYVINDGLIESKVGLFNSDWLHDTNIATGNDSVLDAYKKAFKQKKQQPKGKRFDEHLPPGTSTDQSPQEAISGRNDVEWATQIAAAANAAKAQGKLPAGLERLLQEVLEPVVDWQDKITSWFSRKVGNGSYDWKRPDRRYILRDIYAPGRSGFGAGTVVIAVDTSGSITDRELNMFFAEMSGILSDVKPKRMVIMWCDAKVHRTDEIEESSELNELRMKKAPGGGGTSFIPVFDEIRDMGLDDIDALIYFTDGYGSFPPKTPDYPMIWGNISGNEVTYPFGDIVDIPRQA